MRNKKYKGGQIFDRPCFDKREKVLTREGICAKIAKSAIKFFDTIYYGGLYRLAPINHEAVITGKRTKND